MDPADFQSSAAGVPLRMPAGYWAFIPAPLPPQLDLNPLTIALSEADAALSELSGVGRVLPNPDLLIAPYVNREAVASSQIEGTQADLSDLFLDEVTPERTPPHSDVLEVRNYVAAMELGVRLLETLPLASRLVREVHAVLLGGVRGEERMPGEFRRSQNWIRGGGPADALYVPPPPDRVLDCVSDWEKFANRRDLMPPLVQCAVLHAAFETIHPFLDGNGRVGRLLVTLFLIERGRLSRPLLYLSSHIERTKTEYFDRLQRVRTHGDWAGWIGYFLGAVTATATGAVRYGDALLKLRDALRGRRELAGKHRAQNLIDLLFRNPYLTVPRTAKLLGVAEPTADRSIRLLESIGVLREITGRRYGRTWLAEPVRDAIRDTPPAP